MTTLATISDNKIDKVLTDLSNLTKNTETIRITKEEWNKTEMFITVPTEFEYEARQIIDGCKYVMSSY
tara:strand:+ start:2472 stop:2675 length:204 start_codon:yes stop_codon:yes gene_type:complete